MTHTFLPTHPVSHSYKGTLDTREALWLVECTFAGLSDTLIGKVLISKGMECTTVTVPYHILEGSLTHSTVNALGTQLAHSLGTRVELRLIRLSAPYLDASILAQWLAEDLGESTFSQAMGTLITLVAPHGGMGTVIGIMVQLSGRLMTEPTLPRTVVQTASLGSFRPSPDQALQSGSYTMTNAKGAYTVKVWLSVKA